jgi:predicted DNA binding CopG/RHH family protein
MKDLITQELEKHGIKPNPQKQTITDAKSSATVLEKAEQDEIEQLIQEHEAPKPKKRVVVELTEDEISHLKRQADNLGIDWKTHFHHLIYEAVFKKRIGESYINTPSQYRETITAPSSNSTVRVIDNG